jgi:hypothetical protein
VSSGSDTIRMVRCGGNRIFYGGSKNSYNIKKSYNTSFTRREVLNMIFAQNVIYIFVPSKHLQQLMIPFCPKSDGKHA